MFSHNTGYNKFLNCKKRWISQTSKKNAGWNEKKRKEVMWDRNSNFYTHITIILNMIYMVDRRGEKVEKKLSKYFQQIDYHNLDLLLKNRDNQGTDNPEDEVEKQD